MFGTPGSRARRLRRGKLGPATYNFVVNLSGVGIISEPFAGAVGIAADLVGGGDIDAFVSLIRGTDYTNIGGQGDRTALIDVFFNKGIGGGAVQFQDITNAVDGAFGNVSGDAWWWTAGTDEARLMFDFRPTGYFQVIDEIKLIQQNNSTHGNWVVEAWNGDVWQTLKTSFVLGGAAINTIVIDNSVGWLIYQLRQVGGTRSQSPWLQEFEFKIARGDPIPVNPTNYANVGGVGDRQSLITISSNIVFGAGIPNNLIDGVQTSGSAFWNAGQTGRHILFDFTSIGQVLIDEIRFRQGNTSSHGFWIWQGSNDTVNWVDLGNWFELFGILFGDPKIINAMRGNRKKYTFYRMLQVSGTTSASPNVYEFEFKIGGATKVVSLDTSLIGRGNIDVTLEGTPSGATTWKTGDRRSFIACTVSPTDLIQQILISGGQVPSDPNFLLAGGMPNLVLKNLQSSCWIKFQFDSPTIVDGFKWYQDYQANPLNDHGTWQWQGSNDNSAWTNIGATFTLTGSPGNVTQYLRSNGTAYTWYRLLQTAGTTHAYNNEFHFQSLYVRRIEFKDNAA